MRIILHICSIVYVMFKKLLKKIRKHKFDLDNPEIINTRIKPKGQVTVLYATHDNLILQAYKSEDTIKYKIYVCKACGEKLGLELWQMKQLPWSMARGCSGKT